MNDLEINTKIVELQGWQKVKSGSEEFWYLKSKGLTRDEYPDYFHDWRLTGLLIEEFPDNNFRAGIDKDLQELVCRTYLTIKGEKNID